MIDPYKHELFTAKKELAYQKDERKKRAAELALANVELLFQQTEKEKRAAELILANSELLFQQSEKGKRAAELVLANSELLFQQSEKGKRAAELVLANDELLFQQQEKQNRATELIVANEELTFQNKEKEKRAAELSIANKELVYQNIEKEKRAQELTIAYKDLVVLQKRNDSFMSMASHELKTPVTTIKTLVQILQVEYKNSEDTILIEYLATIGRQIEQLTQLVIDLLDVSKIKADKFKIEEKEFDFDELTNEIVQSCQLLTSQHTITVHGKTSARIKGDRNGISRVFINLITNAIKYSPKTKTIIVSVSQDENDVCVSIKDFGIGISRSHHEKIFDRFFQVGNKNGQSFAGLGIGLYITASIVAQHKGRIWVESSKGKAGKSSGQEEKGSTFLFRLPKIIT